MWFALKRLTLGLTLIGLTSGLLLLSDWNRRIPRPQDLPQLALIQHASQAVLDEGVQGMIQGLAEMGFKNENTITIQYFNAENDMPTANAIATDVTDGRFDLLMTASTLSLQSVAHANKKRKIRHVFALVSDPFGAGVGISRVNPLDHPPYLVGYGTMQPVEKAFRLAKKMLPTLASVGVAWNPAESNSEANTILARQVSQKLGLTLVEAAIENSSGVFEAASSLVSQSVEAIWVGGDLTVIVGFDALQRAADHGKIPVFTNIPLLAKRGALFDLGANYYEVGRDAGILGGQVLKGTNPATIPVTNSVSEKLVLNLHALEELRDPWQIPQDIHAQADTIITASGVLEAKPKPTLTPPPGRTFRIGIVYFGPDPVVESGLQGFLDGLKALGFVEGQNLEVKTAHAQGEMVNIPSIIQSYLSDDVDLIVPLTTPCLTAAAGMVKEKPVVFSVVYDPIAAGAGASLTDHLPNVTGVGSFPPVPETIELIQALVPTVQTVGTLYNSSEANSRKVVGVAREIFQQKEITLEEVTISNSSEVFQAAQAVATRGIDALWITGDNTAFQAFEGIVKVAEDFSLPLIINDQEFTPRGALACQGVGFYKPAYSAASLAARVLLGENPQDIPFENMVDSKLCINFQAAQRLNMTIPKELIQEVTYFIHMSALYNGPATIGMVTLMKNSENGRHERLSNSLMDVGLKKGIDFVIKNVNETDLPQLSHSDKREKMIDLYVVEEQAALTLLKETRINNPIIDLANFPEKVVTDKGTAINFDHAAMAIARSLALRAHPLRR